MLQIRTTIQNQYVYLDLYQDEPVLLSLSFAELQDITKKNSNYSQNFNLPGTKKNNEVFNFFYDVNAVPTTFDPNDKFDAVLMWDGYEIMQGHIRLNGVTINKGEIIYAVTFYNQIGDLMANIGDKFLFELNLSGLSHPYTDGVIFESQIDPDLFALTGSTNYSYQNGQTFWGLYSIGYEYYQFNNQSFVNFDTTPLVQFSPFSATTTGIDYFPTTPYFDFSGTPLNNYYFKPSIQVKTLYEQIFNDAGYQLESDFMNTSYFRKFYLPQKFLDETIYPRNALVACYSYSNQVLTPNPTTPTWLNPISAITCNDLGFSGTTTGITIDEQFSETYQFRFTFTVNPTQGCDYSLFQFPYAVLYFYDGITTEVIYSNTFCDNQPSTVSIDRSLIITGTSTFGFYFLGEFSFISGYTQQIINPPRFIPTGSTIDYALEFPENDYKQIDFITSINKMFNLVVVPNPDAPDRLIVEPIVDYIGKGVVLDWTTKVDYAQTQSLIPTTSFVNGTLEFQFKKDQDYANDDFFKQANRVFGSDLFNLNLPYKNDTTKFDFIFSSPIDITVGNVFTPYITVSSMSKVQTQDQSGTTLQTFVPFKILPKLIFRGITLPNDNYGYIGGTGTTTGSSTCSSGITFTTTSTCPIYYDDCFGNQQVFYPTVGSNTINDCGDSSTVRAALVCFPYPTVTLTSTGTTCGTVTQPTKYQTYYIESTQMDRFQNLNRFTTYPFNYTGFSHYINYRGEDQSNVTSRNFEFVAEDLYDIYYKPYVEDLISQENKVYSCKIYLLPQDVQGLRWNEKILINNTYFRINKITNFNMLEPSVCDIELIKLTKEYEGHRKLSYTLTPCSSGTTRYSNSDLNFHLYAYAGNFVELFDDNLNNLGCHSVSIGNYNPLNDYRHYYISSGYTFSGVSVYGNCGCTGRTQFNLTQQIPSEVFFYYNGVECSSGGTYTFVSTQANLETTGDIYEITNTSTSMVKCVSGVTTTYTQFTQWEETGSYIDCFSCNPVYDTDAEAYLNAIVTAGAVLDFTQSAATNTLFVDLKDAGIYTKITAMYPFLGGSAATNKFNAKNPADTDAAYRLSFNGGWTHGYSGSTSNGSNAYANTHLFSSALTLNNMHMSVYMTQNIVYTGSGKNYIGASNSSQYNVIGQEGTPREFYGVSSTGGYTTTGSPLPQGGYCISTTANTSQNIYRNGTLRTSNSGQAVAAINQKIYIAAMNNNGTPIQYYDNTFNFVTIGSGLVYDEVTELYDIIQAFNTTLIREV